MREAKITQGPGESERVALVCLLGDDLDELGIDRDAKTIRWSIQRVR